MMQNVCVQMVLMTEFHSGGGGGTQIWFGQGCAAQASKLLPIFKGHFGRKGTHC